MVFYTTVFSNPIVNTCILRNLLFNWPFLVCFLKWPTIVIYKLPGSLPFCHSTILPNVQNLFRRSDARSSSNIPAYFGLTIPLRV
jgi:hypothetical protein